LDFLRRNLFFRQISMNILLCLKTWKNMKLWMNLRKRLEMYFIELLMKAILNFCFSTLIARLIITLWKFCLLRLELRMWWKLCLDRLCFSNSFILMEGKLTKSSLFITILNQLVIHQRRTMGIIFATNWKLIQKKLLCKRDQLWCLKFKTLLTPIKSIQAHSKNLRTFVNSWSSSFTNLIKWRYQN